MKALCIKCGASKNLPWQKCQKCGFSPTGENLVKSVYCSIGRFEDGARRGAYEQELEDLSNLIKRGDAIIYEELELERLRTQKKDVESLSTVRPWGAVFRFFLPAILFLAALYIILTLLRM